jgi:hypothetical protein
MDGVVVTASGGSLRCSGGGFEHRGVEHREVIGFTAKLAGE